MIHFYPNDPAAEGSRLLRVRPTPGSPSEFPTQPRLQVAEGLYEPKTLPFQFWQATEALRRGKAFWTRVNGRFSWHSGAALRVTLRAGRDFNAYYDRRGLMFFFDRDPAAGAEIYACESPDIVCHEQGHAFLDVLRPDLWDSAFLETAALHEAFGDCAAILISLQETAVRSALFVQGAGHAAALLRSNLVSRVAEQFGIAIHAMQGARSRSTEGLRDAWNKFAYVRPETLPATGPDERLTAEPHSFSRVFTGAIYLALAYATQEATGRKPTARGAPLLEGKTDQAETLLLLLSQELAKLLVDAIRRTKLGPRFFRAIAEAMVEDASRADVRPVWPQALLRAFVQKRILPIMKTTRSSRGVRGARSGIKTIAAPGNLQEANHPRFLRKAKDFLGMPQVCELRFTCHDGRCLIGVRCRPLVLRGTQYGLLHGVEMQVSEPVEFRLDSRTPKTLTHSGSPKRRQRREAETHARAFARQLAHSGKVYPHPLDSVPAGFKPRFAGYTHAVVKTKSRRRLHRLAFA
ncbi:MAG: hypothetical protein HY360_13885 [Verrucomicrobia bacterium]|nr:hypothetical protein [Verrucomicrobiota bacterium]